MTDATSERLLDWVKGLADSIMRESENKIQDPAFRNEVALVCGIAVGLAIRTTNAERRLKRFEAEAAAQKEPSEDVQRPT